MPWKGTETFVVDTKQLISSRDSPPTQIPMICHWMLSAPMSCYSPLRSSLQLSSLGHLWCTGSQSGASRLSRCFTYHPLARTHTRYYCFSEEGIREYGSHWGLTRELCTKTKCIKALLENSLLSKQALSDEQPWNIPKYYTDVLRLRDFTYMQPMSTDQLLSACIHLYSQTIMQILAGSNITDLNQQVVQYCHIKPTS